MRWTLGRAEEGIGLRADVEARFELVSGAAHTFKAASSPSFEVPGAIDMDALRSGSVCLLSVSQECRDRGCCWHESAEVSLLFGSLSAAQTVRAFHRSLIQGSALSSAGLRSSLGGAANEQLL